MFTIAPPSVMSGTTACVTRNVLRVLSANTVSQNAVSISSSFFRATMPPALLTRTSTRPPNAARVSLIRRAISSACVTSARTAIALPPAPVISATSAFARSALAA